MEGSRIMRLHGQSHGGTRYLFGVGLALLAMLVLGLIQPVGAQVDRVSCGFFETQEDAQAELDARPELAEVLDYDGNGIACEELQTGGPIVVVCNEALGTLLEVSQDALDQDSLDFPFHRATQAEIAAGTCAVAYPVEPTVVVCNEALGTLLEISQDALDQGILDFPSRPATQAEIAAGTCADTVAVTPGGEGESDEVVKLPATGTGRSGERSQQGPLVAVLLVLTVGAIRLRSRIQRSLA